MFRADGQTDITKLIVAFGSFANAPKNNFNSSEYGEIFPNISEACSVNVMPVNDARY